MFYPTLLKISVVCDSEDISSIDSLFISVKIKNGYFFIHLIEFFGKWIELGDILSFVCILVMWKVLVVRIFYVFN